MNIEGLFREIQNWAINNDVLLVEADINENKSATATLPNTESNEALFQLIKKLEVKTVIYRKVEFSNETCDYFSKMISQVEDEEIIKRFEKLKTFRGNLLGFAIHFANNGLLFRFSNFLEIAKDFFEVQTVISEIEFENSEDSYEAFPQAKINEYAKELANHINYINLKNRKQRENLALELFESEFEKYGVSYAIDEVVAATEQYFITVIKPRMENELKERIKKYKQIGLKKVEICSELGISKDTLNKYY